MIPAGGAPPSLTGVVNARGDAVVDLPIIGPNSQLLATCVVDTGFTGELMVPDTLVAQLRLPRVRFTVVTLADGSPVMLNGYRAEVLWLSVRRRVLVYATTGHEALLGSALLAAHRLTIDYPARTVEIV